MIGKGALKFLLRRRVSYHIPLVEIKKRQYTVITAI